MGTEVAAGIEAGVLAVPTRTREKNRVRAHQEHRGRQAGLRT